jgi:hypothetical protein
MTGCPMTTHLMETNMEPKYPNIIVQLVGQDGNAFAILGRVQKEMKRGGVPRNEIDTFMSEATKGNYDELLATVMKWVEVE